MTTRPGTRNAIKPNDDPTKFVGRVVNGVYRIDSLLESGGMGLVFKATRLNFNREVAIKILRPSLANDIDIVKRFQREMDVLTFLSHPNIVSILDVGRDASGFSYFVMDFVQGETMAQLCDNRSLSLGEILEILRQVCSALSEAHEKQIIHRDIKLDNIIVRKLSDGRLHSTLLDFGVAKDLGEFGSAVTRVGELPGTPGIIAPELVDESDPIPASDLYSVGVLLFIAVTGTIPFKGDDDLEVMRAHLNEPIPDIRGLVDNDVPEQVVDLIYELMQKDPELRPESAADVITRIENIVRAVPEVDVSRSWKAYVPPDAIPEREESSLVLNTSEIPLATNSSMTPASVVGMLIAILIILVLMVCYLLYRQMFLVT